MEKPPAFEVLHLEVLDQANPMASPAKSMAEFDILHGGDPDAPVEAAGLKEHLPPHRAAGPPEGGGLLPGMLVDEMVEQVFDLGGEVGGLGGVVIGAEDRLRSIIARKGLENDL